MIPVVILGAGGFAREVLDVFEASNEAAPRFEVLGFLVDAGFGSPGAIVSDRPVLGTLDWLAGKTGIHAIGGVGDNRVRSRLVARAAELGAEFCSVVHPSAVMTRRVALGRGVVVTAGCVLTNHIRIGDHTIVNLDSTIGHDAVLGDYVNLSPGVHVSGSVRIETGAFIGTGAVILERRTLGPWCTVGAGAVVTADVAEGATVVGVPARAVRRGPSR